MAFIKSVVFTMLVAASLAAPGYAPSLSISHAPSLSPPHAPALSVSQAPSLSLSHAPAVSIAHAPVAVAQAAPIAVTHEVEYHAAPHYEFKYGVHDGHTNDVKEQAEKRVGDKVEGYYSLVEPDGTKRTVHYTADHHTGFNAVVSKSGHSTHPTTPAHAAPVVSIAHADPTYSHAAPALSIPSFAGHGFSGSDFDHGYGSYH